MKKRVTINQKHTIDSQSQKEDSGSIAQKKIIKTTKEKIKDKEQRRNKNQRENKVEDGDKYIHIKNYLKSQRTKHTKDTKEHTE